MARKDGRERAAFRSEVQEKIADDATRFEFLVDQNGNWHSDRMAWRDEQGNLHEYGQPGFHSNEGPEPGWFDTNWDASHNHSYRENEPNFYSMEDSSTNRSDGALEREGHILEKEAIEIDGLSINKEWAETMEARGLLEQDTVESADSIVGWNVDEGIVHQSEETSTECSTIEALDFSEAKDTSLEDNVDDLEQSTTESIDAKFESSIESASITDTNFDTTVESTVDSPVNTSIETATDANSQTDVSSDSSADAGSSSDGSGSDGGDGGD